MNGIYLKTFCTLEVTLRFFCQPKPFHLAVFTLGGRKGSEKGLIPYGGLQLLGRYGGVGRDSRADALS